jgi:hypothetical protein
MESSNKFTQSHAIEDIYGIPAEERKTVTDWVWQRMNNNFEGFVSTIHGKYRKVKGSWGSG